MSLCLCLGVVCVVVLCGVCGVVCVVVWCGVVVVCVVSRVYVQKRLRVYVQKRLRVYVQNVPVCTGTTPACVTTCGRGAGTHGDVLILHTEGFFCTYTRWRREEERERREVTVSSAYQEKPTKSSHLVP